MTTHRKRTALLLGAGFSKAAGYPLVDELTDALRRGEPKVVGEHPEAEALHGVVDAVVNGRTTGSYNYEDMVSDIARAYRSFRAHEHTWPSLCDECEEAFARDKGMADLRRYLMASPAHVFKAYYSLLGLLHDELHPMYRSRALPSYLANWLRADLAEGAISIVNLNHDELIWMAATEADVEHRAGFDGTRFDLAAADAWTGQGVNEYKIHGSVCWTRLLDGATGMPTPLLRISTRAHTVSMEAQGSIVVGRPRDKWGRIERTSELAALTEEARARLVDAEAIVIVGYGGGDDHVNDILAGALEQVAVHCVVVDPSPTRVIANLERGGVSIQRVLPHHGYADGITLNEALALING